MLSQLGEAGYEVDPAKNGLRLGQAFSVFLFAGGRKTGKHVVFGKK